MFENDHQLIKRLIGYYVPLYNKDFPLILFWTPKSGCTTFNKWFFFQIGLIEKVPNRKGGVHGYRDHVYRKEPVYTQGLTNSLIKGNKDTYKLVRNPYRRAVSSFLHTISNQWLISKFNSDINKGISFKQFLYHLKDLGPAINKADRHISLQYIEGEERFIKNYIKLEKFANQIREIESKYGLLKAPLSQLSTSPHHFSEMMNNRGEFAETVITKEKFEGNFPTFKSFYNNETKRLVKEIYSKDFEVYDYDQDSLNI
ncbi:sulfotransferase family 2 domain-containing protein [Cytobacillus oceanisediminis]|uniref:Sulfotransferase family protein n=1 Tax=Cytobacillus oceanisediminis TaxID=665099 RepID=A0A562K5R3_9BACI|nr:sulfotransferase family 2 domain-containing protein [Cytobacillus oceanisediminis]TWH90583.1 sulfotransferase family protein [Cytobacillus oceanisediminis]